MFVEYRSVLLLSLLLLSSCGLGKSTRSYDKKYQIYRHLNKANETFIQNACDTLSFKCYSLYVDQLEYHCLIPLVNDTLETEKVEAKDAAQLEAEKDQAIEVIRNFNLEMRGKVALKPAGYWYYAVRFDHDIHQYHVGASGLPDYNYKLAAWSNNDPSISFDSKPYYKEPEAEDPYAIKSNFEVIETEDKTKYVSQRISNGETCDLTGLPRTTTINYFCNVNLKSPLIVSVNEWRTCEYIIDLQSSYFCDYDMWMPPKTLMNHHIDCYPNTDTFETLGEKIDIHGLVLDPLTEGVFLGRRGESRRFVVLLTKDYNLWNVNGIDQDIQFEHLLSDIASGFQKYTRNLKLSTYIDDISTIVLLDDTFKLGFETYDGSGSYIGNIMVEHDRNGYFVSYFTDEDIPEESNWLEYESILMLQ